MAITKFDHVSIYTRNPNREIEFYRDFFGYELESNHEIPEMNIHVYHLKNKEEHVELISPLNGEIFTQDGIKHIAYKSDDIEADFRLFKEKGADIIHERVQRHKHSSLFFIRSPGGIFIEIIQHF